MATQVCRTCTTESTDWVHAMENPKATVHLVCAEKATRRPRGLIRRRHGCATDRRYRFCSVGPHQNGERLEKLRRAVAAHTAYMSKAVDAQGCDRHILGPCGVVTSSRPPSHVAAC